MSDVLITELNIEDVHHVSGGSFLGNWALGEALNQTLKVIYDSAQSSTGGNSDMSSWNIA
jgi:hypothetical protein